MKGITKILFLFSVTAMVWLALPTQCPAPLIWRKGEGWTYEREGVSAANNPQDQLKLAKSYQAKKDYGSAIAAYRRLVRRWPTSSAAQDAQLGLADCLSARGYHYHAFKEYQQLIEKHPNTEHFATVLQRQFEIGNLFLSGERQKAWGIRWFPSPERAIEIFEKVIKNGPYSEVAPAAQFRLGLAYEKIKDYTQAVRAYEKLLERYPKHNLAEAAQFQIGYAYRQEANRSEYDQNAANQAIVAFTDFLVRYPGSEKAPQAHKYLAALKQEQSKGLFRIAQFYEKNKNYRAALIYYNEVIEQNPQSDWAISAKDKVAKLNSQAAATTATP